MFTITSIASHPQSNALECFAVSAQQLGRVGMDLVTSTPDSWPRCLHCKPKQSLTSLHRPKATRSSAGVNAAFRQSPCPNTTITMVMKHLRPQVRDLCPQRGCKAAHRHMANHSPHADASEHPLSRAVCPKEIQPLHMHRI